MQLSVLRNLSPQGGALVFGGCPGLVIRADGGLTLSDDLLAETAQNLQALGVRRAVCHIEPEELQDVDYADIDAAMARAGITITQLPVPDFSVPDATLQQALEPLWLELAAHIRRGDGVFLHCLAGEGRSALMAGCVLVRLGLSGQKALESVRAARPTAIETRQQLAYLLAQPAAAAGSSP